jgi:hypothetical protein
MLKFVCGAFEIVSSRGQFVGQQQYFDGHGSVFLGCGDVAGWLPLLSQTQAAIEAIEAAMRESLTPG